MSAWTTIAKTIDRTLKKYLPDEFDPIDIHYRPYDSIMGDKGWIFIIEEVATTKTASISLGMNPTKLIIRQGILGACDRLKKEGQKGTDPKIQKPTPGQVRKVLESHG